MLRPMSSRSRLSAARGQLARRAEHFCFPSALRLGVLFGVMYCLVDPVDAAKMNEKEHAEAVRSLARGDPTVSDRNGNYFWKVEPSVAPTLPKGSWYLYFGSGSMPQELMALVKQPDGRPATKAPKSSVLLSYTSKLPPRVTVPWYNGSPYLITPALKASVPRSLVLHARWEPDSSTLKLVDAPASCTGTGYPPTQPGASADRNPLPLPQLLLFESAAVAGLLPKTGVRDAVLPTIDKLDADSPALVAAPDGSCRLAVPGGVRAAVEKMVTELGETHWLAPWEGVSSDQGRNRLQTWANEAALAWRDHLVDRTRSTSCRICVVCACARVRCVPCTCAPCTVMCVFTVRIHRPHLLPSAYITLHRSGC